MCPFKKHPYAVVVVLLLAWHYSERKKSAATGVPNLFNMIGMT